MSIYNSIGPVNRFRLVNRIALFLLALSFLASLVRYYYLYN